MLIISTMIVLICSYVIATQNIYQSFSKLLLTLVLYSCLQVIITELILGIVFQNLTSFSLLVMNGSILVVGLILFFRNIQIKHSIYLLQNIKNVINEVSPDIFLFALIGLALIVTGYIVYLGYLFPPYAYDSLTYHLPPVASWIQNEKISIVPGIDGFSNYYPKNAELLFLWNLIFLKNDIGVDLIQFVFWLIGSLTVYSISRHIIKMDIRSSFLSGLLFFFTPMGLMQSKTCYVDVIFTAFFLIAVFFALDYILNYQKSSLLLTSLTMGILAGIKPQSLLYISIIFSLIMFIIIIEHRYKWSHIFLVFTGILVIFIALSGYWYLRNYMVFQNPLFPFEIKISKFINLPGFMSLESFREYDLASRGGTSRVITIIKNWFEIGGYYQYDSPNGGLGILWITMMMPAIAWKLTTAWKNKEKAYLYLFAILFLCFIFQPLNWLSRYVIYITAIGAISLVWCLNNIQYKKITAGLIFILIIYQVTLLSHQTFFTLDKVTLFHNTRPENRNAALFAGSKTMELLEVLSEDGDQVYFHNIKPNFTYPLWGSHLERKVYQIDANFFSVQRSDKPSGTFYLVGKESEYLPKLMESDDYIFIYKDLKNYYLFIPNNKEMLDKINRNIHRNLL